MQVGLVRHFKIPYRKWQWINSTGYADFLRWYDGQEGRVRPSTHPHVSWQRCFSSDMLRARETANTLADVPPVCMPLLREIPQAPVIDTRIKAPLVVWHVLSRVAWWFNHRSQVEGREESTRRVARIVEWLRQQADDQTVLVVTHGFLLYVLRRELKKAGFRGMIPLHPKGGEIYLFAPPAEQAAEVRPAVPVRLPAS